MSITQPLTRPATSGGATHKGAAMSSIKISLGECIASGPTDVEKL